MTPEEEIEKVADAMRIDNMGRTFSDLNEPWESAAKAAIKAMKDMGYVRREWQPIEIAPRDGTKILTYNGDGGGYNSYGDGALIGDIAVSAFDFRNFAGEQWYLRHCCDRVSYCEPTHWMPLPQPPKGESDD